jgi:hypothetical protein
MRNEFRFQIVVFAYRYDLAFEKVAYGRKASA